MTYLNTIIRNAEKVNSSIDKKHELEAFYSFIEEEEKQEALKTPIKTKKKPSKRELLEKKHWHFFSLVPAIQKSAVWWQIDNRYKGDIAAYIKTQGLFLKCFTKTLKARADDVIIVNDDQRRQKKKLKKEALLYSSQLLRLIGDKGTSGTPYLNSALVDYYLDDLKEQEEFLAMLRLVNAEGKFIKLESIENRKKRKVAQVLNISSCLAKIAKDRGYTFALVTLTLPPHLHANPSNKNNSFDGTMPLKAYDLLNVFWQRIRARLQKKLKPNDDFFGCSTVEGHKDGVLHKHVLIYFDKKDLAYIRRCVKGVAAEYAAQNDTKLDFDFKLEDKKKGGSGATYIFKYITKTFNSVVDDKDNTGLKNIALRWYYSARGFDFFGLKRVVAKFEYLTKNYRKYSRYLGKDLNRVFKTYDYYSFITKYEKLFKSVRDKGIIRFVTFDLPDDKASPKKFYQSFLKGQKKKLIIKEGQLNIFEANNKIIDGNINYIGQLDEDDLANANVFRAWQGAKDKEQGYLDFIDDYKDSNENEAFIDDDFGYSSAGGFVRLDEIEDLIHPFSNDMVTIKQSDSRKDNPAGCRVKKRSVFDLFDFSKYEEKEEESDEESKARIKKWVAEHIN